MVSSELFKDMVAIYKFTCANGPTHRNVIRKKLLFQGKISSKEKFSKVLNTMISLGKLNINKEIISINPDIVKVGVLQRKGDKFYIILPNNVRRFEIDKNVASSYKSGDVLKLVIEETDKRTEVVILRKSQKELEVQHEVREGGNRVLGRVVKTSHDNLVFIPNNKSFAIRQVPILNNKEEQPAFQDKICVMEMVSKDAPLMGGYIVEVKGEAGNPIHEYDSIAESHGAIMSWEGDLIGRDIEKIPTRVDVTALKLIPESCAKVMQRGHVVDLRDLCFMTVDPALCQDMDDAIYSSYNENGDIVCYVAVANVTKYVNLNSEIGKNYIKGAFSIYAPNKAYGILPSQLSTGICSLNPEEDRLAFVVKAIIDKHSGEVKESAIYDAVVNSKKKYSYDEAQSVVDELGESYNKEHLIAKCTQGEKLSLEEQTLMNYYAGQTIKNGFDKREMLRFVSNNERDVLFDDGKQKVVDIKPVKHLFYHEVIEAFMITANEVTAKYAKENNLDNIYRVHDEPNQKKVDRSNEFFKAVGVNFDGNLSVEGTRRLIELIKGSSNEEVVNDFLIRMQSRAVYSNQLYSSKDNPMQNKAGKRISHYALQSPHYSHSTSPIRRLPDYITHYNILAHIHGTKPLSAGLIEKFVEVANTRQIAVDQAEKEFEAITSVLYCEQHIGEKMHGRVIKIANTSAEDGLEDDIVVIVKNESKGVCVEIPLSQVIGRDTKDCEISHQRCAVYDNRGNVLLTLCKSLEFIIENADRKEMRVVGSTNKELVMAAEDKETRTRRPVIISGSQYEQENTNRAKQEAYKQSRQLKPNSKPNSEDESGM